MSQRFLLAVVLVTSLMWPSPSQAAGRVSPSDHPDYTVVHPVETEDIHVDNPGMGWELIDNAIPGHDIYSTKKHRDPNAPVGSEPDQTYDKFGNAYILSTWAELEPQPGVYDWSLVDRAIDHWSALGKRIQFRIATDPHVIIGYKHPDADRHEVYNRGAPDWLTDPEGEYAVPTTPKCHDAASVLPDCAPPRPWTPDQGGLDPSQYKRI